MSESTCPPLNLIPDRNDKSVWDNMRRIQAWANSDCCDCNLTLSAATGSVAGLSIVLANSPTVSFGISGSTVTASAAGGGGGGASNINVSAGTTSNNLTKITFADSNGISFGLNASTITASYTQSTHAHTGNLFAQGNTVLSSSTTFNATALTFAASGAGLSAGVSNGSVLYSLSQSTHAHTGNISATGNTIATNSVSMTYDQSALVFAASGAGLSAGVSNGSVVYSLSQSTHSHAGPATKVNPVVSAGVVGAVTDRYALEDHQHAGINSVSVVGNTAGATSAGAGSLVLAGGPNITLSCSTNPGGMTVSVSGGAGGGGGGATVSVWPNYPQGLATSSVATMSTASTGGSSQTTVNSIYIAPFILPNYLTFNEVEMVISCGTAAGTGSMSAAHMLGIYTLNAGTALSLSTSFAFNVHYSQNSITSASLKYFWGTNSTSNSTGLSTTNMSSILTGLRNINLYSSADSLTPGHYFIGYLFTSRTSGANVFPHATIMAISESQTTAMGVYFGSNTSHKPFEKWQGVVSTTTNGTTTGYYPIPASIHTSAISHTGGTSQWMWPFHLMYLD